MKIIKIVLILFVLFSYSCKEKVKEKTAENVIETVSVDEFKEILDKEDVQLIDVRRLDEFEEGYIADAELLNINDEGFITKATKNLDKNKPVLLYCKAGGIRSIKAAESLEEQGYSKVYNLQGGIIAWEEQGYKLTVNKQTQVVNEKLNPQDFKALIETKDVQLIDVRRPNEYAEGHLKNAKNINFYDDNFMLLMTQELDRSKPVYLYCRSGGRSGKAATKLSEKGYKVYDLKGGILDWKANNYEIIK